MRWRSVPGRRAALVTLILALLVTVPLAFALNERWVRHERLRAPAAYAAALADSVVDDSLGTVVGEQRRVPGALRIQGGTAYAIISGPGSIFGTSIATGAYWPGHLMPLPRAEQAEPTLQTVNLGHLERPPWVPPGPLAAACSPTISGDAVRARNPISRALSVLQPDSYFWACVYLDPTSADPGVVRGWLRPIGGGVSVAALVALVPVLSARRRTRALAGLRARAAAASATAEPDLLPVDSSSQEIALVTGAINDTIRQLRRSLDSQRRFVADAAHELRSPLASMIATLDVAQAYPGREDPRLTNARVLEQSRRLQGLVEDLLLLARLDARAPSRDRHVDLAGVAREVAARARPRAGVRVVADLLEDLQAIVVGDESQLERVLTNLVDNAIRHAEATVTVRCARARSGWTCP